jgi:hypothetical protein
MGEKMDSISESQENKRSPRRIRALVVGAILGMMVTAGFLIVIGVILFREVVPPLTEADFQAALERWRGHQPKSYDCDIEIFGNRPGTVRVEVRDGVTTKMTRDGVAPRERSTWEYWTVEGQFDTIERELEMAESSKPVFGASQTARPILNARFHSELGYPEVFRRSVPGVQQEMGWKVIRFEAVGSDGSP